MREQAEQARARLGRCDVHAEAAAVATCRNCGRRLCLSCAIPFRGEVLGPECAAAVLDDEVALPPVQRPSDHRGDRVATVGFALLLALTVLPWSRFGDRSGPLEAWTPHWSLLAATAALIGLGVAVAAWVRPAAVRLHALAAGGLALVAGAGAVLHFLNPPPLSEPSLAPLAAAGAAGLALLGSMWEMTGAGKPSRR